jgi:hypothetical protein
MKINEFRAELERFRARVDREANAMKDSYFALGQLDALYRSLGDDERVMADDVIAEWVMSPDECVRFDALALIREFRIVRAKQGLERLQARLAGSAAPGATFEFEKVTSILDQLNRASNGR